MMAAQNALTVAATAEAEMAAEVVGDAMNAVNAVSVVSAQKDGPRVAVTIEVRVAMKDARIADQTVAAQNAVNARPTRAAPSNELSHEVTVKNSATRAHRVNHANHGKVVAKIALAVNAVNAQTAMAAPMSSAHQ